MPTVVAPPQPGRSEAANLSGSRLKPHHAPPAGAIARPELRISFYRRTLETTSGAIPLASGAPVAS